VLYRTDECAGSAGWTTGVDHFTAEAVAGISS
jgi:hypothetical protein